MWQKAAKQTSLQIVFESTLLSTTVVKKRVLQRKQNPIAKSKEDSPLPKGRILTNGKTRKSQYRMFRLLFCSSRFRLMMFTYTGKFFSRYCKEFGIPRTCDAVVSFIRSNSLYRQVLWSLKNMTTHYSCSPPIDSYARVWFSIRTSEKSKFFCVYNIMFGCLAFSQSIRLVQTMRHIFIETPAASVWRNWKELAQIAVQLVPPIKFKWSQNHAKQDERCR